MANFQDYNRTDLSAALNAKLHQGYDPGIEHKEQGNLYSAVQFGQQQNMDTPVLMQILDGFAGALRNVANGISDVFNGNAFNPSSGELPSIQNNANGAIEAGGSNNERPADFGSNANFAARAIAGLGNSASPLALSATAASQSNAQISIVNNPPEIPPQDPPIDPPLPPVPPVLDNPVITAGGVSGNEDQPILLNIGLTTDPGSVTFVTIDGVPNGATLSAGVHNSDGTWTLTPAQLTNLAMIPAQDASGTYTLSVTAISTEGNLSASVTNNISVTVNGVADIPLLNVQNANGNEDTQIALNISAALTDIDGSEMLSVVIGNMPAGAVLSAGINNGDGTWTLTPAQLANLTFTPPLHVSGDFELSVTAISSENNTTATANADLHVIVDGVAETPVLSVMTSTGDEDTAIALHINAALQVNDGSETLSIVISGVPSGAVLSAGIDNGNGTWTLTEAQLQNLTITPPLNSDADFVLQVTAVSSENGHQAMVTDDLSVIVHGVADLPNLSVNPANGNEASPIALNISASLVDNDGSETLSIVISGVPNGATLSAGIDNHNGTWTLTPAQLQNLTITPLDGFSGNISLGIAATASEDGSYATANASLSVTVNGDATPPLLSVTAASGNEDSAISLNINAALVDNDGSEILSILISGVPAGAALSAGTDNGNGTWSLTPAQLANLTITPPANSGDDFILNVTATSSENSTTASISASLPVNVIGVADLPNLSVQAASGNEDSAIALNITASLNDTDRSESLSIDIGNVPAGAILSAGIYNGNGHWSLTPAQLAGLTITTPAGFEGAISLSVIATATESDGDHISTNATTLAVNVNPVVHVPEITLGAAIGSEDTPIALNISIAPHGGDVVSIVIGNVPAGAVLSAGIDNGNGTWTLTEAQLQGLTILPPHNSDADFNLSVVATATASNNAVATDSDTLHVVVNAVADVPNVVAQDASGAIDTNIGINISGSLNDTDGSESITYVIAGVPDGFAFNHGSNNGNNKWTFTQSELAGLTLTSPYHFQGTLHLTAYSVSHEAENGSVALSAGDPFSVTVGNPLLGLDIDLGVDLGLLGIGTGTGIGVGVNIANILDPAGIVLQEDSPLLLNGLSGLLGTVLTPLQQLALANVVISGLPAGVTLSDGIDLGNGSYQLTSGQLNNLYLISPPNSDQDFTLSIDATLLSLVSIHLATTAVHVIGVADVPTLTVANASAMEGDALIPLNITSSLVDIDGSEKLSITISNLPAGFICNIGINNADGTWTIPVAQLANLALIAPANWSGDATYTVVATSTEREGDSSNHVITGQIHVGSVTDTPAVTPPDNSGSEGQPVALSLGISLGDVDGSEHLSSVIIGGIGAGFSLSHGTDNHDSTWTVNPADLNHLQLNAPGHFSGDVPLTVTAIVQESLTGLQASATGNLNLHIEANADTPTLSVQNSSGDDQSAISLNVSSSLVDTDGSEHLSIILSGIPDGVTLSAGLHNDDGSWSLQQSDMAALTINTNQNFSGDLHLTATAVAQEQSNGDVAMNTQHFTVHVEHAF